MFERWVTATTDAGETIHINMVHVISIKRVWDDHKKKHYTHLAEARAGFLRLVEPPEHFLAGKTTHGYTDKEIAIATGGDAP